MALRSGVHECAELLASLWRLGAGDRRMTLRIRALDDAISCLMPRLPTSFHEGFGWIPSSLGMKCTELDAILNAGLQSMCFETDGTTFTSVRALMSEASARMVAVRSGLSSQEAKSIGTELGRLLDAAPGAAC